MQCKICGNSTNNERHQVREQMFGYGDAFDYFLCTDCGVLQIETPPTDLSRYYPEDYYAFDRDQRERRGGLTRLLVRCRDRHALRYGGLVGRALYRRKPHVELRSLARLELSPRSRILDVGCGSGGLLYALEGLGFESLLGIDPFSQPCSNGRGGVQILDQSIDQLDDEFDLIMFHHSFEHAPDPLQLLQGAQRLLRPHGTCLIRVPTVSSFAWRHYGVHWVGLDAPRHHFLFSTEGMARLAGVAGFEIRQTVFDSSAMQFWASEQYQQGMALNDERSYLKNPRNSPFSAAQIADFERRSRQLNQSGEGDCVAFYLQNLDR